MNIFPPAIEHENNFEYIPYRIKGKFVKKLYYILEISETKNFIKWSNKGSYFIILDEKGLENHVFPYFFKHNSLESFIRSLNMYGFKTFDKDGKKSKKGLNLKFRYWKFKRGNIENLDEITLENAKLERKNNNNKNDDNFEDEDDDTSNTTIKENDQNSQSKFTKKELLSMLNLTVVYNYDINNLSLRSNDLNNQNIFINTNLNVNVNNNWNGDNHLNTMNNAIGNNYNYNYQNTININQNNDRFNSHHHLMMINNNFSNYNQPFQNQHLNIIEYWDSNDLQQQQLFNNEYQNFTTFYPFTF